MTTPLSTNDILKKILLLAKKQLFVHLSCMLWTIAPANMDSLTANKLIMYPAILAALIPDQADAKKRENLVKNHTVLCNFGIALNSCNNTSSRITFYMDKK